MIKIDIPTGVRRGHDGRLWLPRNDSKLEAWLDKNCVRTEGLVWYPKTHDELDYHTLAPQFKDRLTYIVGKGPSLDHIGGFNFEPDSPIICINESVHKVAELKLPNPLFCLQQDAHLHDACRCEGAAMLCSPWARHWYFEDPLVYVYNVDKLGLTSVSLSAAVAIKIAKELGTNGLCLVSFDGCVKGDTDYAKCIGHPSREGGDPKRFLKHRKPLVEAAGDLAIRWVTPVDLSV